MKRLKKLYKIWFLSENLEVIFLENRVDEPLKSGACDECIHCVQMKRTKKCDDTLTKTGKYISCREIRVCNAFNRTCKVEGQ